MTRGDILRYRIAFALSRASKIIRGLKQGLTEAERYAVADHVVGQLKERGDPWGLSDEAKSETAADDLSLRRAFVKDNSMRRKVVVWRSKDNGAVYFEQSLPGLIRLLDIAILHRPYPRFRRAERSSKRRIKHQTRAGARAGAIRGDSSSGCFTRELESERSLPVRCPWQTMAAVSSSQIVRTTDI